MEHAVEEGVPPSEAASRLRCAEVVPLEEKMSGGEPDEPVQELRAELTATTTKELTYYPCMKLGVDQGIDALDDAPDAKQVAIEQVIKSSPSLSEAVSQRRAQPRPAELLRWVAGHPAVVMPEPGALAWGSDSGVRTVLAGEPMDAAGDAYAEFTNVGGNSLVGVATAGYDAAGAAGGVHETAHGWMYVCYDGGFKHSSQYTDWTCGKGQVINKGETVGLRLKRGTLSAYKDGALLGVLCEGLSGRLVWAADLPGSDMLGCASVRISRKRTSMPALEPEPEPEPEPEKGPFPQGYLAMLSSEEKVGAADAPVRTQLLAAQQHLAFAGLLSDRLVDKVAGRLVDIDVIKLVAVALCNIATDTLMVACVFSGLVDAKRGVFDRCGALCHIATQGGTTAWQNPADAGHVAVAWSSVRYGPPSKLVSGPAREGWRGGDWSSTQDAGGEGNPWMAVDLGAGRRMEVTGYALRHGGGGECQLRSWELQGSEDGLEWVRLDKREDDTTLGPYLAMDGYDMGGNYWHPLYLEANADHYEAGYWAVNQQAARGIAVRHVRIMQTGKNDWSITRYLSCGGLELYGVLREEA
jgi:hypothetical protein